MSKDAAPVVVPGSFDPITRGHLDVIERAHAVFGAVVVAVGVNAAKTPWLDADVRVELVRAACTHLDGVEVVRMDTPVAELCHHLGARAVVKGVRSVADLASEAAQAQANRELGGVETVWLPTDAALSHVSSSLVRELARWGMDAARYVPPAVARILEENGRI